MLAALTITSEGPPPVVELVAPTGKAAARLAESIAAAAGGLAQTESLRPVSVALAGYRPRTIHRLLGSRGRAGFTHDARHPLTADVVVVDEASMVSAHLMARLLEALRPDARLVLVGDPDQLTSVEAGAVMADIVRSASTHPGSDLAASVVRLEGSHRFGSDSAIGQLADAIRSGDANMVMALLEAGSSGGGDVQWSDGDLAADHPLVDEVATHARQMVEHSRSADASAAVTHLGGLAVLCANRAGPNGVAAWNTWTELALNGETPSETPSQHWARRHTSGRRRALWYPGRPVMVTANDYVNGLFNGDVGVVVVHNGGRQVAFADDAGGVRLVDTGRLGSVATMWATTIHKSQGSEYDQVVVVLPDHASPLLTRQLLYTAVTRARHQVTVVGAADIVRQAVLTEVARASGLTDRLA
jgi:exodeoxyribonuclease V alpha subunit